MRSFLIFFSAFDLLVPPSMSSMMLLIEEYL